METWEGQCDAVIQRHPARVHEDSKCPKVCTIKQQKKCSIGERGTVRKDRSSWHTLLWASAA